MDEGKILCAGEDEVFMEVDSKVEGSVDEGEMYCQ